MHIDFDWRTRILASLWASAIFGLSYLKRRCNVLLLKRMKLYFFCCDPFSFTLLSLSSLQTMQLRSYISFGSMVLYCHVCRSVNCDITLNPFVQIIGINREKLHSHLAITLNLKTIWLFLLFSICWLFLNPFHHSHVRFVMCIRWAQILWVTVKKGCSNTTHT